jgi:hypothetical protein
VGNLLFISVAAAMVLTGLWYFYFAGYNRRKGMKALRWVEAACVSRARILEAEWVGTSRLQARLRFAERWFDNARVTIHLRPRPLPVQWLLSYCRQRKETLTFEADLDYAPGLRLEVLRHQWLTHRGKKLPRSSQTWNVSRPGPVVLTTSTQWQHELPPLVNTLMTSRGHNLLNVRLRPESPHLAATIDLQALSGEDAAAAFLGVLRDLAAGASTSRH